jgi:hypothetical protein
MPKKQLPRKPPPLTAQEMGKRRWLGVSAEERSILTKKAAHARGAKYARERAEATLQIPESIAARLADIERSTRLSRFSFYYTVGYELGLAQLDRGTRNRMLRTVKTQQRMLERDRRALVDARFKYSSEGSRADEIIGVVADFEQYSQLSKQISEVDRQRKFLDMTLAALRAPVLDRFAVDREKLAAWDDSAATASLRSILTDSTLVAMIPSSFRAALLYGLRAGALGEAMLIDFITKERGAKLLH